MPLFPGEKSPGKHDSMFCWSFPIATFSFNTIAIHIWWSVAWKWEIRTSRTREMCVNGVMEQEVNVNQLWSLKAHQILGIGDVVASSVDQFVGEERITSDGFLFHQHWSQHNTMLCLLKAIEMWPNGWHMRLTTFCTIFLNSTALYCVSILRTESSFSQRGVGGFFISTESHANWNFGELDMESLSAWA